MSKIKVTLIKSTIGCLPKHKQCINGLGLRRINHTVERLDTPENRGLVNKVSHLVKVQLCN